MVDDRSRKPGVEFVESPGGREEYAALFETTGWNRLYGCSAEELETALAASRFVVSAYEDGNLVGSGRIVSDGLIYGVVFDLIVTPAAQGRGIGTEILKRLLARCDAAGLRDVLLFAAEGTRDFYERNGFVARPGDKPGMIRRSART